MMSRVCVLKNGEHNRVQENKLKKNKGKDIKFSQRNKLYAERIYIKLKYIDRVVKRSHFTNVILSLSIKQHLSSHYTYKLASG